MATGAAPELGAEPPTREVLPALAPAVQAGESGVEPAAPAPGCLLRCDQALELGEDICHAKRLELTSQPGLLGALSRRGCHFAF